MESRKSKSEKLSDNKSNDQNSIRNLIRTDSRVKPMLNKGPNFLITPQEVKDMDNAEKAALPGFSGKQGSVISVGQIKGVNELSRISQNGRFNSFLTLPGNTGLGLPEGKALTQTDDARN